jgi:hypothetical protein
MRKHFRRSPDYGDAVAFAIELARRLGATAGNAELTKVDPWGKEIQKEYDELVLDEMAYTKSGSMDYQF